MDLGKLGGFVVERAKSLVSKKVGVTAIVGSAALAAGDLETARNVGIGFVIVQATLDGWKHYVDARWSSGS